MIGFVGGSCRFTMDENGDLEGIETVLWQVLSFSNPIDMQFDKEGVMYLMEYGKGWFSQNLDARISRIEYNGEVSAVADAGYGSTGATEKHTS